LLLLLYYYYYSLYLIDLIFKQNFSFNSKANMEKKGKIKNYGCWIHKS